MAQWVVDTTTNPPSFLPAGLKPKEMIPITKLGDKYQVYFDPKTGVVHNGETYRAEAIAQNKAAALVERRLKGTG